MTYLLFVVLATVIWYGRSLRAEHDTTVDVRVQYVGIPGQVMTAEPLPPTIRVTFRRSRVSCVCRPTCYAPS